MTPEEKAKALEQFRLWLSSPQTQQTKPATVQPQSNSFTSPLATLAAKKGLEAAIGGGGATATYGGLAGSAPVATSTTGGTLLADGSIAGAGGAGLTAAGIGAGAYTGYQQAKGVQEALKGDDLSIQQQLALALPTGGASFLYNPTKKLIAGKKDKDQQGRDRVRAALQQAGILDPNYGLELADKSTFDIGRDGGDPQYNVDFSKQGIGDTVGLVNPLAEILTGGDDKLRSDFAGYFTNAASSNAQDPESVKANVLNFYKRSNIDLPKAQEALNGLLQNGKITAEEHAAYANGLGQLFGSQQTSTARPQQQTAKPVATARKRKPLEQIPEPPEAPIIAGGPTEIPVPTSIQEFADAYQSAMGKTRGAQEVPDPFLRRLI